MTTMSALPSISPSECIATISVSDNEEYPRIFKELHITARHPDQAEDEEIASISGTIIDRTAPGIRQGGFLTILDDHSDDLHQFSQKLFDKYGKLKSEVVEHEFHRGTGCWGREMDSGKLVYVESVRVEEPFRHKGVGSWMLQQLFSSPYVGLSDFVCAWPTSIDRTRSKKEFKDKRDIATSFFHKNDFRRIGRSAFFAYSPNPNHTSRAIPLSEDVPANDDFSLENEDDDEPIVAAPFIIGGPGIDPITAQDRREAEHETKYPLHHAIANSVAAQSHMLPPGIPAALLQTLFQQPTTPIEDTILHAYASDPTSIHKQDDHGLTPLHLAAGSNNLAAVRALLSPGLVEHGTDMDRRDNSDGATPLECCENGLRSTKEFCESLMGRWEGHSDDGLRCAYLLRKTMGEDVGEEEAYVRKKKWGCTCGQCTDGWLSPRMRYRLQSEAIVMYDMMQDVPPVFQRGQPLETTEILINVGTDYIPPQLWPTFNKTFYNAYCTLFKAIHNILSQPDGIPTPSAIINQTLGAAQYFLSKGGKAEYALDAVIQWSDEQSPNGDGTWDEMREEDLKEGVDNGGWEELVRCVNDLEFGLVRERVGLGRDKWGPYSERDMEVDFDDDDDGDDDLF